MVAIIDAGSTKIDWLFTDHKGMEQGRHRSMGYNPHLSNSNIDLDDAIIADLSDVDTIHYYGTGINSQVFKDVVKRQFKPYIPESASVEVMSDILGTCRALFGMIPGIGCILGTGSNSCVYDGKEIVDMIPNLGYVLADEASGSCIGRTLLSKYFNRSMPKEIALEFKNTYNLEKEHVLKSIYKTDAPSKYLASFAPFAAENKSSWMLSMMKELLNEFVTQRILPYDGAENYRIGFTGSISFIFRDLIEEIFNENGLQKGIYIKRPIDRLLMYHTQQNDKKD